MAALASDDRIPTEIIDLQQALDISDRVLISKYGQPESAARLISENRGSSNEVKVYEKTYGGKNIRYAVRTGTYAAFKIEGDSYIRTPNVALLTEYESNSYESNTLAREEFLEESKNSEKNWVLANEKGLSPELYFYGYIKHGKDLLKLCTISEAFNMDLNGFISTYGFGNEAMQESIATQLFNLFNEMPKKMSMICFDIKPQNTVIKFDQDAQGRPILNENFVIKLIDWDADWCRDYKFLRSNDSISRDSFRKASAMTMIMVMANFFYIYYHQNILRDKMVEFYNEDRNNAFKITKVMMNLFKAGAFGGSKTEFTFMARHYFRAIPNAENMTHEDFLFEMFKRSISRNETEFGGRVGFQKGRDLILKGGKKRKTRRKYKRKTKRVQTKKRRRKSNIKKKRRTRRKKRISKKKRNGGGLIDLWNARMAYKNTKNDYKFYKNYFSKKKRN